MELDEFIKGRAKWLYMNNSGCDIDDMKNYVKQAIDDLRFEDGMRDVYLLYDISYDDYVEQTAKDIFREIDEESRN